MLRQRSTVFDAIAHPVRRHILEALNGAHWVSITDLAERIEVSRSTASRHLDILRRSGLVKARRVDQATLHHLKLDALEPVFEWIEPLVAEKALAG